MKKLAFLLLVLLLLGFNYGCSKKNNSEETIKKCKNKCRDDPNFCSRICEKEILDPRWKFLNFDKNSGSAFFMILKAFLLLIILCFYG